MRDVADADRYVRALEALRREGLPPEQEALLREHWRFRKHMATWADLARKAGHKSADAAKAAYEALARRVGERMGLTGPPHPLEAPEPDWVLVLALVSRKKGARGQATYILRRNVIEAMARVGMISEDDAP